MGEGGSRSKEGGMSAKLANIYRKEGCMCDEEVRKIEGCSCCLGGGGGHALAKGGGCHARRRGGAVW